MIYIENLNGIKHNLADYGLRPKYFVVESPSPKHYFEEIEGRDGLIDVGTSLDARRIKIGFTLSGADFYDYYLLQNKIFSLLSSKNIMYLSTAMEPKKRWKVKIDTVYEITKISQIKGEFEAQFVSLSPYAESIGTTLDPFTFVAEKWQVGQGLITDNLVYAHQNPTFRIFNAGDVEIDPRNFPLKIEYKGESTKLAIKNETTGDEWRYTGVSTSNDTITLDGIRSLKNGQSILRDTNKKLITLKKGWNDFALSGVSGSFLISFDFRFYYF